MPLLTELWDYSHLCSINIPLLSELFHATDRSEENNYGNPNVATLPAATLAPPLALPDAEAARRIVARWLKTEIGDALYLAEATFVKDSFAWHVAIWFSTASKPLGALATDVYLSAATGAFLGRPSREQLAQRLEQFL